MNAKLVSGLCVPVLTYATGSSAHLELRTRQ